MLVRWLVDILVLRVSMGWIIDSLMMWRMGMIVSSGLVGSFGVMGRLLCMVVRIMVLCSGLRYWKGIWFWRWSCCRMLILICSSVNIVIMVFCSLFILLDVSMIIFLRLSKRWRVLDFGIGFVIGCWLFWILWLEYDLISSTMIM